MKRLIRTGLIATALLSLPAVALAGGPKSGPCAAKHAEKIADFDGNGDGKLDREERKAMKEIKRAEMLQRFDANKDGTLDKSERMAAHQARLDAKFAEADANGDGVITQAEADNTCRLGKRFARIDANGDGLITKDEMKAAKKHHGKKFKGKRGGKKHKQ